MTFFELEYLHEDPVSKYNHFYFIFKKFLKFIHFERDRENKVGRYRERGRERESQVGSAPLAQSPMRGLNS